MRLLHAAAALGWALGGAGLASGRIWWQVAGVVALILAAIVSVLADRTHRTHVQLALNLPISASLAQLRHRIRAHRNFTRGPVV